MVDDRLKRTAYHEGGHAVVSVLTRRQVKKVTIVPDGETLGEVVHYGWPPSIIEDTATRASESKSRRWLFREMIIHHAGMIAEAKGTGGMTEDIVEWGGSDSSTLADYVLQAFGDSQKKVDQTKQETKKLLDAHWEAVEAIAAALLEHRTLSGKRVRAIVMENGGRSYLVRGGQESAERKNRGARATIDSRGGGRIPPPGENVVWVCHQQPITVEAR